MSDKPAAIDSQIVQQFVGNAHGNFDAVKQALEATPSLLNAAWDWGGGDWETALGAAAHMGRRDIAMFLIERGARIDIFAAAMLGWIGVVQSIIENDPAAREAKGPHGIPLLAHAAAGKEQAQKVVEYLQQILA